MKRLALAAMAMALFAGSAVAQVSTVHTALSGYGYQLIDLDPNDGIAPSITFGDVLQGAITGVEPVGTSMTFDEQWSHNGEAVTSASSVNLLGAHAAFGGGNLAASGQVGAEGKYLSLAGWQGRYTLSANTTLVFTGHATASVDAGAAGPDRYNIGRVTARFFGADGGPGAYFREVGLDPQDGTGFDEWITLTVVNDRSASLQGQFEVSAYATGAVLSPVPEPAAYLMLGTGLALAGAVARRRARR